MGDLANRTRLGISIDNNIYKALDKLSKETMAPKSRLIDKAIILLLKEYGIEVDVEVQ